MNRIFLFVLDSFGVGEASDAKEYGDISSHTLKSISESKQFKVKVMENLGLYNIDNVNVLKPISNPIGAYGKLEEQSKGKDTTTGHWEMMGLISKIAMPTFPNGFPQTFINEFEKEIKTKVLCNKAYSGTEVIKDYGQEHLKTKYPIVYTSGDSVFQIAAHEDIISLDKLYEYCQIARNLLKDDLAVGRVIARPFTGTFPNFYRTPNRHDFSLQPNKNVLNYLSDNHLDVIGVGKISDIFNNSGITKKILTKNNNDCLDKIDILAKEEFNGLCFINLVDFDMVYGHRNDVDGYAQAISYFDNWLGNFITKINDNDLIIITADHGCDPKTPSTDHSREYVPLLVYKKNIKPINLGIRLTFADIGKTITDIFNIDNDLPGTSFKGAIK
ncbi:MAG: phosphopentomutase [Bacilli bacterium]